MPVDASLQMAEVDDYESKDDSLVTAGLPAAVWCTAATFDGLKI
jgi:hypothetical protein